MHVLYIPQLHLVYACACGFMNAIVPGLYTQSCHSAGFTEAQLVPS